MLNMNRNGSKGFTLVEVIVVAVIVAILAAVAIPIYVGYVSDSAKNMVANEAASLSAAVSSALNYQFSGAGNITVVAPTETAAGSITWKKAGFPGAFPNDVTYKMQAGVVPDAKFTAADFLVTGTSCVLTFKTKTATASW